MGRELEFKYTLTDSQYEALVRDHGPLTEISMQTAYYDTPQSLLSARRQTLRLRREGERSVCTFKLSLPDGSRGEWETDCGDISAALPKLVEAGAPAMLLQLSGLTVRCGARFTRLFCPIPLAGGEAELAIDRGVLLGGGRELPFREAELELKQGDDSLLEALDRDYTARYALRKEPKSKFARAAEL